MEDNNKKICPFCGKEINKNAKKCRFCNNWIDEEIPCPYCAEMIKASAKKCRYCGEWLNKDSEEDQKDTNLTNVNLSKQFKKLTKYQFIILGATTGIIILLALIIHVFTYIPTCKSSNIQSKLKENLISNNSNIEDIILNKSSAAKIKRVEKGYSCSIDATIDDTPSRIEYTYKKVGFNEFDINAKFVLPNCFDSSVKNLLNKLIKESKYYNIDDNTSNVSTNNEVQNDYDKEAVTYSCSAEAELTSKPGKAYTINSWDYEDASREMKCHVDYRTFFCKNGYTTCVSLTDVYSCEYKED